MPALVSLAEITLRDLAAGYCCQTDTSGRRFPGRNELQCELLHSVVSRDFVIDFGGREMIILYDTLTK